MTARLAPDARQLAGLLAGYAVLCDYSGVVVAAVTFFYAWIRSGEQPFARRWRVMLAYAGAFLPGVGALAIYQAWAFGSLYRPSQHYMLPTALTVARVPRVQLAVTGAGVGQPGRSTVWPFCLLSHADSGIRGALCGARPVSNSTPRNVGALVVLRTVCAFLFSESVFLAAAVDRLPIPGRRWSPS